MIITGSFTQNHKYAHTTSEHPNMKCPLTELKKLGKTAGADFHISLSIQETVQRGDHQGDWWLEHHRPDKSSRHAQSMHTQHQQNTHFSQAHLAHVSGQIIE